MRPRRQQATISFQSDRAKARLSVLTSDGRSQAEVIEQALDAMPDPRPPKDYAAWVAEIEAILDEVDPATVMTMKEFDAIEYDENGIPR